MTVRAILERKSSAIATIEQTAGLASAVKLLAARRIGALVVTSSGRAIAGIISERDIIRVLAEFWRRSARTAGWTGDDPQSGHLRSRGHD